MARKDDGKPSCPKCETGEYVMKDDVGQHQGKKAGAATGLAVGAAAVLWGAIDGATALGTAGAIAGTPVPVAGNAIGGTAGAVAGAVMGGIAGAVMGSKAGEFVGAHFDHGYTCSKCGWHSDAGAQGGEHAT